jgi:hypothetical protein
MIKFLACGNKFGKNKMMGANRKEGVTTLTTIGARGGWRF